ncbi:hypothetical protein ACVWXR_004019 [Pseudomonas lurida]
MIEINETEEKLLSETVGRPFRYYVNKAGVYLGATDGEPLSAFEVEMSPASSDQPWLFPGWGPSPSNIRRIEEEWRAIEMPKAQQNVTAIEYGEPGDAQAWKSYWLALRKWTPDNPDFPDSSKRPVAPI